MEQLAVITGADLVDWGRVQIDKDGAGYVFTTASFGKDGVELAAVVEGLCLRIRATILLETVFEKIPYYRVRECLEVTLLGFWSRGNSKGEEKGNSQLPCAVSELGTSLANMEMKNLCEKNAISFCLIPYCAVPRVRYPSSSSPISSTTRLAIADVFLRTTSVT